MEGARSIAGSPGLHEGAAGQVLARLFRSAKRRIRETEKRRHLASGQLSMGRFSYGRPVLRLYEGDTARVRIGSFVSIAEDVEFFPGGNHWLDYVTTFPNWVIAPGSRYEAPVTKGDIVVGNDVWLGRGSTIYSGVTIGDGAVVAGKAVVANDVRPYAVVVGNPAREQRLRFSEEQVEALQRIKWWDWPDSLIFERIPLLCGPNVDEFIAAFAPS